MIATFILGATMREGKAVATGNSDSLYERNEVCVKDRGAGTNEVISPKICQNATFINADKLGSALGGCLHRKLLKVGGTLQEKLPVPSYVPDIMQCAVPI